MSKITSRQVFPVRVRGRRRKRNTTRAHRTSAKKIEKQFINKNGEQASSDEENANTIHLHFCKILDRSDVPVDPTVLNKFESLPIDEETRTSLQSSHDRDEIKKAIKR
jgi:hypothetical protein